MSKFKLSALYTKKESTIALEHAVLQSLLNWSRAQINDALETDQNKQGWWGNEFLSGVGCRDWTLARSKQTNETLKRAKRYTEQSLQWLIDRGIATKITVETNFINQHLNRIIKITLKNKNIVEITL